MQIHQQSGALAQVELGLAVYCAENFFGQDCNCRDTDDASGHFTCDGDGNKMCNDGYTDPATNCIQCIPSDECCKHINSSSYIIIFTMAFEFLNAPDLVCHLTEYNCDSEWSYHNTSTDPFTRLCLFQHLACHLIIVHDASHRSISS